MKSTPSFIVTILILSWAHSPLLGQEATDKSDTTLFKDYLKTANELQGASKTAEAYQTFLKAAALARSKNLPGKFQWQLNDRLGVFYGRLGNYDSAVWYHEKAVSVAPDTLMKVASMKTLGFRYNQLNRPVQALEILQQALVFLENKPPTHLKGTVYNNLGILYEDDGNLKKAEEYYLEATRLFKSSTQTKSVMESNFDVLNNLGILYSMQKRYDESLKALAEAEQILPLMKSDLDGAILDLNVGNTLCHMGKPAESLARFERSMVVFKNIGDEYGTALCHRQLGEALHDLGRNAEAERHEFQSLKISKAKGYTALVEDSYHDLTEIYEAQGDFANAYKYHKMETVMKDSANAKEKQSKLGLLEKEFEITKKEKEKQRLERENELQAERAKANRTAQAALGIGLGLFVLAAGVAGVAWLRTREKNIVLAAQKAKIEEQTEQLREAARNKSRFFANVSHELRTPITLLNGMLELMQEGSNNGSSEKLRVAVSSSRRLQNLVDEVLDLSRLEVGKAALQTRRIHILPLLNRIVMAFESLLMRKNVKLIYESEALEEVAVDIDEDKFEKIINNLISNAVKFNKDGGWIKVTGSLASDNREVVVEVSDSGIGIPQADLPHIFERFYQSKSGDGKNAQGIGIGLSLVREFTELHGGTVLANSIVDEGTSFKLTFPVAAETILDEDAEVAETGLPRSISFSDFKTMPSILIVEDNDEMRYYLREILGNDVVLSDASNGVEGLRWLETNKPDLIISDVMMPEMNGYELLTRLKEDDRLKGIPVIMLTARASEEDLLSGLSLGVDDYIIKPFNARELKSRIHNLLMNQQIRSEWKSRPVEKDEELPVSTEDKVFIEKIEAYVTQRVSDSNLNIGDIADHLAMSERQLYRKCSAAAGMAPAQLVKEIRLRIAYRMLVQREVTKVGALASSVGFENSAYFSKQFLERYGKKPVEFL